MQRDAEATKQRLIAAGRAEFAAYGLMGSRVDRIAEAAQSNKAQIYHYFKSKAGLFDAVWEDLVGQIVDGLPLVLEDLPGVAVTLCDIYTAYPDLPRLITWQRLERAGIGPNPVASRDVQERIRIINQALADGVIRSSLSGDVLFALILHMAAFWEFTSPDVAAAITVGDGERRREVIRTVVSALVSGADGADAAAPEKAEKSRESQDAQKPAGRAASR